MSPWRCVMLTLLLVAGCWFAGASFASAQVFGSPAPRPELPPTVCPPALAAVPAFAQSSCAIPLLWFLPPWGQMGDAGYEQAFWSEVFPVNPDDLLDDEPGFLWAEPRTGARCRSPETPDWWGLHACPAY